MTDQTNKLQALVDDRWTYILYLKYEKENELYKIPWIPLSMDEEGNHQEGIKRSDAASTLALEMEVAVEAKSLTDWEVSSEDELTALIIKDNNIEYERAVKDLKSNQNKLKDLSESEDIKDIDYHLQNVVGRYERWFTENTTSPTVSVAKSEDDDCGITKSGDGWIIKYRDEEEFVINDLRGMKYIVELLLKPGASIHVNELLKYKDATLDVSQALEEGLSVRTGEVEEPLVDSKAKHEIEKQLAKLYRDIAEAKAENTPESILVASEIEKKIDKLEQYLNKSSSSRPPISKSLKNKSDAVRKAIQDCIDQINRHSPKLAEFLNNHVKTGFWLAYKPPDQAPPWWIRI